MQPSFKQLRYFIAAADAGQISRAAIDINVSQSAITMAIRSLEETVGARLFDRHPHGISVTYEGSHFLENARHILAAVDEAVNLPKRLTTDLKGTLRLAVTYTVAGYFLSPYLARFARNFPNIKLRLTEADRHSIEDGLVSGVFDLAVMLTSNIENADLIDHDLLFRSRRRLWLDANHRFLDRKKVTLQDVADNPYIMLTIDEAAATAQKYWDGAALKPDIFFRTSSLEAVRSMVASGMGIAILSDMVYRPWSLEGRRIEVVSLADKIPSMDIGFSWPRGGTFSDTSKAFIDFMRLAVSS